MSAPGPRNLITDIAGLCVGNATDEAARSGVTVVLCPGGWTAAVDVRGGAPGSRELAALGLETLVGRAWAIVLAGGSVFGLGAADGVTAALSLRGEGLRLSPSSPALPVVPAAVLHDLGNGGDKAWGMEPPYRRLGIAALEAAAEDFALGAVGAGRGARAGLEAGGLGSASLALEGGPTVGALVAANPVGTVRMPDGRSFWACPFERSGEFGGVRPALDPPPADDPVPALSRLRTAGRVQPGGATTLAVVAVGAALSAPECQRVAMMAQDGLARAIRPAHTPFDGDLVFCVADGPELSATVGDRQAEVARIGSAAADTLARAIARAVFESAKAPPAHG